MKENVDAMGVRIGVDASNLGGWGSATHLSGLLQAAHPEEHGIERVVVWGGRKALEQISPRPWLDIIHDPMLDDSLLKRVFRQHTVTSRLKKMRCDLLFVPGGNYIGSFRPFVTMSRNMLPFENEEMRRFGFSWMHLKLFILRKTQAATFRRADGMIYLSEYARDAVSRLAGIPRTKAVTIPHGVGRRFYLEPRPQRSIFSFSDERPFRLLYVSAVTVYKHQWHVAEAVGKLKRGGIPLSLDLIGPAYPPAERRLREVIQREDPRGEFVRYLGPVLHDELTGHYRQADAFVFASSCENMPNVLLEAMISGLPIASSNRGPMREVLGNAGVYFNPEDPEDIAHALRSLIEDPALRDRCARGAFECAGNYTWERCARETFRFLALIAGGAKNVGIRQDWSV